LSIKQLIFLQSHAEIVSVRSGENLAGVNISVPDIPGYTVSGQVIGAAGPLIVRLKRILLNEDPLSDPFDVARSETTPSGRFVLPGVPSGDFTLVVSPRGPSPPAGAAVMWARASVTVGMSDVGSLSIPLNRGMSVKGRVAFEEPDPSIKTAKLLVFVNRADGNTIGATMGNEGTFTVDGLIPGIHRFFLNMQGMSLAWLELRGKRLSSRDLNVDSDIEDLRLVLTKKLGRIDGRLPSTADPRRPLHALLFTAQRSDWNDASTDTLRTRSVICETGRFSFSQVPAGEYFVAVLADEILDPRWKDPENLARLAAGSVRLAIGSGDIRQVTVPEMVWGK